ncbi:hypothetical protein [Streptomyces sp. NPDC020362]|uniref:hypothetical protein n=1 Tax=unclassified Streptomyces TaxID=2593676 RepID=UPI000A6F4541
MSALPKAPRIRRTIAMTAAALAFAGGATVATTGTAHAVSPAGCSWTRQGNDGTEYVKDGNGNWLIVGWIEQQYDYCGNTRAVFNWNNNFRTTAHPGITGAWVTAMDQSWEDLGTWTSSGQVGSLAGPSVPSPSIGVHTNGVDGWTSESRLHITYSNGVVKDCWAYSDTHDYHSGNTISGHEDKWCQAS